MEARAKKIRINNKIVDLHKDFRFYITTHRNKPCFSSDM